MPTRRIAPELLRRAVEHFDATDDEAGTIAAFRVCRTTLLAAWRCWREHGKLPREVSEDVAVASGAAEVPAAGALVGPGSRTLGQLGVDLLIDRVNADNACDLQDLRDYLADQNMFCSILTLRRVLARMGYSHKKASESTQRPVRTT